jgi:flagellar biosynthesis anti-sigma factor FlgM
MRIDDTGTNTVGSPGLGRAQQTTEITEKQAASQARRSGGGDEVNLSALAGQLQAAAQSSPEREARISALAAAYEAGNYQPDPLAIADEMIGEAESYGPQAGGSKAGLME